MAKGRHYRFRKIEFWAERGMIQFVDERFPQEDSRSHDVLLVREFLENLRAINAEITYIKYPDERREHEKLVENGIACAKEAKTQGRPDDPEALRQLLKDRRRNWALGNGSGSTILHTASASETPEGRLLPPMPRHPLSEPPYTELSKRSIIIP